MEGGAEGRAEEHLGGCLAGCAAPRLLGELDHGRGLAGAVVVLRLGLVLAEPLARTRQDRADRTAEDTATPQWADTAAIIHSSRSLRGHAGEKAGRSRAAAAAKQGQRRDCSCCVGSAAARLERREALDAKLSAQLLLLVAVDRAELRRADELLRRLRSQKRGVAGSDPRRAQRGRQQRCSQEKKRKDRRKQRCRAFLYSGASFWQWPHPDRCPRCDMREKRVSLEGRRRPLRVLCVCFRQR